VVVRCNFEGCTEDEITYSKDCSRWRDLCQNICPRGRTVVTGSFYEAVGAPTPYYYAYT